MLTRRTSCRSFPRLYDCLRFTPPFRCITPSNSPAMCDDHCSYFNIFIFEFYFSLRGLIFQSYIQLLTPKSYCPTLEFYGNLKIQFIKALLIFLVLKLYVTFVPNLRDSNLRKGSPNFLLAIFAELRLLNFTISSFLNCKSSDVIRSMK